MYFEEPTDNTEISGQGFAKGVLTINGLFILLAGIFPAYLTTLCLYAMRTSLQG
jgi:NADH-quinone oxidoreductase subunit N